MKKLILICGVITTFTACKKVETLTTQTPVSTTSSITNGLHNLTDFDKVINEITNTSNDRTSKNAINLSAETINALRNSINFDKQGVFHGFGNMGNLRNELTIEQRVAFMEKLTGSRIIILDKDKKIIGQSNLNSNSNNKYALPIVCDDYAWSGSCRYHYDATCVQ